MPLSNADVAAIAGQLLAVPATERASVLEREGESPASFAARTLEYLGNQSVEPSVAEPLAAMARDLARGEPRLEASLERARGHALRRLARFSDAEAAYGTALEVFLSLGDRSEAARTEIGLVDALMYQGRYGEALARAESARVQFEQSGDRLRVARVLTNVGNIHHRTDHYDEALDHYGKAREIFESLGDHAAIALVDFNRANILSSRLCFAEAEEAYERAARHYRKSGERAITAQIEYNVAYLYFLRGNHAESLRRFALVEPRFLELGDRRHIALLSLDRCEIFLEYNLFPLVLSLAAPAQATFLELDMRYEAGKCLAYAGLAAARLERFEEALGYEERARRLFEAEGNDVWLGVVDLHVAALRRSEQSWDEAERAAWSAIERFRRHRLPAREAQAHLVRATTLVSSGRSGDAREALVQARECTAPLAMPGLESRIDHAQGTIAERAGDTRAAIESYRSAVHALETMRSALRVEEMQTQFLVDREAAYLDLARLLAQEDGGSFDELFSVLEAVRSRGLAERMAGDVGRPRSPSGEALARRLREVREELAGYQRAFTEAEYTKRSEPEKQRLQRGILERERALSELRLHLETLEGETPEALGSAARPVRLDELRSQLPEGTTVLEYANLGGRFVVLAIDRSEVRLVRLPATLAEIRRAAGTLRFHWDKFLYGEDYLRRHGARLEEATLAALASLHGSLLAPVLTKGAERLVIVPHGPLHDLPFHAFGDERGPVLAETEIVYAPSATVLVRSLARGVRGEGVLCVGVADDRAPQVAAEMRDVAACWPGAAVLSGRDATWARFSAEAVGKKVVHIASHSVFRQDNPLFSAIRFAEGAWVSLFDVYELRLNASAVVLSACDSGAARRDGGDELMGLLRGFLAAGSASVVASQWPVHDATARDLMTRFHGELASGRGLAQALRLASLAVRSEKSHPYYWAPFKAIGSWNAIQSRTSRMWMRATPETTPRVGTEGDPHRS